MKITKQDLQGAVDTLNRISCNCNYCATSGIKSPWLSKQSAVDTLKHNPCAVERRVQSSGIAAPNAYYLSGAYGGWQLLRKTAHDGDQNVLSMGHRPKRELYNLIWAFIKGIQSA